MLPQTSIQRRTTVFPSSDEPVAVIACLKAEHWVGRHHAVCSPLSASGTFQGCPWVAFGFDHPEEIEFITTKWFAGTGMSLQALEARAFGNVWARDAEWCVVPLPDRSGEPFTILDCNDEWAAERILHQAFMQRAHDMLQTPALLAAIPRRGVLLCADGRDPDFAIPRLTAIVRDQYRSNLSAEITDLLFEVREGRLTRCISVVVGSGPSHTPSVCAASDPGPVQPGVGFATPVVDDASKPERPSRPSIGLILLALILLGMLLRWV